LANLLVVNLVTAFQQIASSDIEVTAGVNLVVSI